MRCGPSDASGSGGGKDVTVRTMYFSATEEPPAGPPQPKKARDASVKPDPASLVPEACKDPLTRPEVGVPRDKPRIVAAERKELVVRPSLDDSAPVEHKDLIRVANRREPVGDRDRRSVLGQPVESLLHRALRLRVQSARRRGFPLGVHEIVPRAARTTTT